MTLTIAVDGISVQKDLDAMQTQGLTAQAAAEGEANLADFIANRVGQFLGSYGRQAQEKLIAELTEAFVNAPPESQAYFAEKLRAAREAGYPAPAP